MFYIVLLGMKAHYYWLRFRIWHRYMQISVPLRTRTFILHHINNFVEWMYRND